jgi:hypothetical protein
MKLESKDLCPLNNFSGCRGLDCAWFIQVRGKNPNTGEDVDEWGCATAWQPILIIENSQQQRQTGAAIESFRNEVVKSNATSFNLLAQKKIVEIE